MKATSGGLVLRNGIWHMSKMVLGVRITGTTKTGIRRDAERLLEEKIRQVREEKQFGGKKQITVQSAIAEFLMSRKATKAYHNAINKLRLFDPLNKRFLSEITSNEVQQLATDAIANKVHKLSTVNVSLTYWNAVINFCSNSYVVGQKVKKIKGATERLRFLTFEEERLLLAQLDPDAKTADGKDVFREKKKAQDNYDFIVALLHTGAREQEIAKLKLTQIDLKNNTITILRSKNGNNSTLHISNMLRDVIERRINFGKIPPKDGEGAHGKALNGWLFPERSKARYNGEWFQRACARALLYDVTLHTMRHTYAARLVQNNVNPLIVQELLGHKSFSSTRVYLHLAPNAAARIAKDVLDRLNP